jgi:uncharacterized protein (DUF488 family)
MMTVGYEGRTADELVKALSAAGVELLVDVRLTPLSRKPGLSKQRLTGSLNAVGIKYLHLPELGNPRDNRDAYRQADRRAFARFRAILRSSAARKALDDLAVRSQEQTVAVMCFERDACKCHRSLVIEALTSRNPNLAVDHL